jgi:hypothetical protein
MSIPPVPPANPDGPTPGEQPTPSYGQQPPAAPQYGQQPPAAPQYGQQPPAAPQYGQNAPQYGQQPPAAPQYGQNAPQYGQQAPVAPQYGQSAPQYGQQAPQYGQSPYAQYSSPQQGPATMPKLVNTAFWVLVASGVVWIVSLLVSLTAVDTPAMREMFEQQMSTSGANVRFEDIKPFIIGTTLVFGVISAVLYALVAFNVRKGKNWARILGTVFAALSVFSLYPLSLATLSAALGIAGIVMLYLPATSPYFSKQRPFANPYGQPGPFGK